MQNEWFMLTQLNGNQFELSETFKTEKCFGIEHHNYPNENHLDGNTSSMLVQSIFMVFLRNFKDFIYP